MASLPRVLRVRTQSLVPAATFATDFLRSALVRQAAGRGVPGVAAYLESLAALCGAEGADLSVFSTEYVFDSGVRVQLFDVKCRARFEDDVIERIAREWPLKFAQLGPVCPLRRGVCVGLLDEEQVVLAVGNCKFFYGDEDEILNAARGQASVLTLSEKANGEYTMLSSLQHKGVRWLTFGSKNVRVTLPFLESNPRATRGVFDSFVAAYSQAQRNSVTAEETGRYSYLRDMVDLWLAGVEGNSLGILRELDSGTTLVGEQVGVHAHIFTGYHAPHIRLFASLPHATLTTSFGCSLRAMRARLFPNDDNNNGNTLRMVGIEVFHLPRDRAAALETLHKIASGSMHVYGEGVVAYVYACGEHDTEGNNQEQEQCVNLFKFKCQEYAFDRRLRTLLSWPAGELARSGLTLGALQNQTNRVMGELRNSYQTHFSKMNPGRAVDRIEMVPAIFAFLDRHQATVYCADFSDQFTAMIAATEERKAQYHELARTRFMQVEDPLMDVWKGFMGVFTANAWAGWIQNAPLKTAEEMAREVALAWRQAGGRAAFPAIGIASAPGGGKTTVLARIRDILEGEWSIPAVVCDRDAYVIADPLARGEHIHRLWTEDVSRFALRENKVVLVGNTFSGGYADKFETQTEVKLFLAALAEHAVPVSVKRIVPANTAKSVQEDAKRVRALLFHVICLQRLSQRAETFADGSTLTLGLGARVVLEKYFSSQPDEQMLKRRLLAKSGTIVSALREEGVEDCAAPMPETIRLGQALVELKMRVMMDPYGLSGGGNTNSNRRKRAKDTTAASSSSASAQNTSALRVDFKPVVPRSPGLKVPCSSADWVLESKTEVKYIALVPNASTARTLHALADVDLLRTDAHLTLKYRPDPDTIARMGKAFAPSTTIALSLTARVTVALSRASPSNARLQFVVVALASSPALPPGTAHLLPAFPHVTLGSTDANELPYVLSGRILQGLAASHPNESAMALQPAGHGQPTERCGPLRVNLAKDEDEGEEEEETSANEYAVWIEPLAPGVLFVGAPNFMCLSPTVVKRA